MQEESRWYPCVDTIEHLSCINGIISDGVRAKRWHSGIYWHSDMCIEDGHEPPHGGWDSRELFVGVQILR